ncbi:MAG: cobalt transporter CbiM [Clostridia bacterium]|nr:cobalt transporter CbiM [Clostridia bacterium]
MHIPDNYLSPSTCGVLAAAMVPVWAVSVDKVRKKLPKEKLPEIGIFAAISFLLMMFNVPLPGGTTGHAVGGTLIAVVLGPWAACISMTMTLLVQALLFGDGGILAFGANCFNMAFVLPFVGYGVFRLIKDHTKGRTGEYVAIVLGSYLGMNAAALFAAIEFGIQPALFHDAAGQALYCPYPLSVSIPAMMIPHLAVAGVVEALLTALIYTFIKNVSPDMIEANAAPKSRGIWGLLAALIVLTPLGLLATGEAWGEWGAEDISEVANGGNTLGYTPKGMSDGFDFHALLPDYSLEGLPEVAGYLLSAVIGVALLVIVFRLIGSGTKKEKNPTAE